ncbi:MAG: phosphonate C-P lyase system protein PhnH [Treponema sp.]|jgi:alpha-D-ribose 1-methylphosphonate 5-triphosphate synthase subunit PhnH|nr:phosphonate C-P lyase system protein PhnH [Treponema sp.]
MTETLKHKHTFDTVHGAQEVFRILLEALANPGRILNLRPLEEQFAAQGRWLAPALTLLDAETGFFWDGDRQTGEEMRFLSGAPQVPLEKADFVFLPSLDEGPSESAAVEAARILSTVKQGTYMYPHDSALLFIAAGERYAGKDAGEPVNGPVSLRGPGIPPEGRRIDLLPAEAAWHRARDEQGFEYPRGVELIFLRKDGSLLALTRKTEILWPM